MPVAKKRAALSREVIIRAALKLIEKHGADNLSMRSLAESLGVSAMALYRYVKNKQVLLELVVDALYGSIHKSDLKGSPEAQLKQWFWKSQDVFRVYPEGVILGSGVTKAMASKEVERIMRETRELFLAAGHHESSIDSGTRLISYLMFGYLMQEKRLGRKPPGYKKAINKEMDIIFSGMKSAASH